MNFGRKWINWIQACACSSYLLITVNGSPTSKFQARRGVRQGNLLSQFLFILAAEGLACLLENANAILGFKSFKLHNNLEFDLLQFADDTIILGQASWENICLIKSVLRGFKLASGLSVNFRKRKIMGFNTNSELVLLNFCIVQSVISPSTFLVFPLGLIPVGVPPWNQLYWNFVVDYLFWDINTYLLDVV